MITLDPSFSSICVKSVFSFRLLTVLRFQAAIPKLSEPIEDSKYCSSVRLAYNKPCSELQECHDSFMHYTLEESYKPRTRNRMRTKKLGRLTLPINMKYVFEESKKKMAHKHGLHGPSFG
ncbi:hypothetical protein ABKN59_010724 [Abortiporus biennis]